VERRSSRAPTDAPITRDTAPAFRRPRDPRWRASLLEGDLDAVEDEPDAIEECFAVHGLVM
jgi:hypothetical protein